MFSSGGRFATPAYVFCAVSLFVDVAGRWWMHRYIFARHPIIPLLVVPPIAFFMTLSSATFGYFIISLFFSARPVRAGHQPAIKSIDGQRTRIPSAPSVRMGEGVAGKFSQTGAVGPEVSGAGTATQLANDGAVREPQNTDHAQTSSTISPPVDESTTQSAQTIQQPQQGKDTASDHGKTSSATGTTSGSSVTSSSTAGEDSSESGTVTH